MRMRLFFVCLIALCFVAPSLFAGGQGEEAAASEDGPMEIVWMGHQSYGYPINITEETNEFKKALEERFNVKMIPAPLDYTNDEQYNLYWAEGNTADGIIIFGSDRFDQLYNQDLVREIEKDWIYEYQPKRTQKVINLVGEEIFEKSLPYNGKYYITPYSNYAQPMTWIVALRQDWMDNLGLETPSTLEEFTDVLRAFTYDDPDSNGKDDTYGLHAGQGTRGFQFLWGAYGFQPHSYYPIDDKIVFTSTMDRYKEALKIANSMYEEGLVDPEFVTDNRDVQRKKWATGVFGALNDHPWWFARSTHSNLTAMVEENNPDASISYMEALTGPYGDSGYVVGYPNIYNYGTAFGKDTSDAKVIKIMEIEESFAQDWDWYVYMYYGKEGWTYEYTDEGIIKTIPENWTPEIFSKYGIRGYFTMYPVDMEDFKKITNPSDMPGYEVSLGSEPSYSGVAFPFRGTNQAAKIRGEDVSRIYEEFYYNAITGKINIDAEWDNYVSRLKRAGLDDIVADYQEAYDKM